MNNITTTLTTTLSLLAILVAGTALAGGNSVVLSKGIPVVEKNTVTIEKNAVSQYRQARHNEVSQSKETSASKFYQVRAGDTLSGIAKRFNVSLQSIVMLNKLYGDKKDKIQVGQLLRVR